MTIAVHNLGILGHFPTWDIFGLGVLGHFDTKIKTRKIVNTHEDFELHQAFMYIFLCQNVLIF